jgi:hypothetical protein
VMIGMVERSSLDADTEADRISEMKTRMDSVAKKLVSN